MSPDRVAERASNICAHRGIGCRYEYDAGYFLWVFRKGHRIVKSVTTERGAIDAAERLAQDT